MDERLIHGQVTVGWAAALRPRRYLVVDDALPESDVERDLSSLGIPAGGEGGFHAVEDARSRLTEKAERVEVAGVLVCCALLGLLLGTALETSGYGFLWISDGCVLVFTGILKGDTVRWWSPLPLLLIVLVGLVAPSGLRGVGMG